MCLVLSGRLISCEELFPTHKVLDKVTSRIIMLHMKRSNRQVRRALEIVKDSIVLTLFICPKRRVTAYETKRFREVSAKRL